MHSSESIADLAAAYAKAQPAIEGAVKDKANPAFRSKYADLGNVVDAIKPALEPHGLSFVQVPHDAEGAAKVETILLHASGQWLSLGIVAVPVTKHDAHGFGSALTYARRYGLMAAFGVAPEDDDGNAAAKTRPEPGARASAPPASASADNAGASFPQERKQLRDCKSMAELTAAWAKLDGAARRDLFDLKEQKKADFEAMLQA